MNRSLSCLASVAFAFLFVVGCGTDGNSATAPGGSGGSGGTAGTAGSAGSGGMDGFSPGIAAMTHFRGATVTGLATPDSIEDSLNAESPTVIINADTGERLAHWVDLDEYVVQAKVRVDANEDQPDFTASSGPRSKSWAFSRSQPRKISPRLLWTGRASRAMTFFRH